jgi:dihydrofolate reductase
MGVPLVIVAAVARNGVIGGNNRLLWKLRSDMHHFRAITMGKPMIMGRRTWESLPARFRPLPGRRNVVLSRNPDYIADGAEVVTSLDEVLDRPRVWVIGGSEIYHLALPAANRCEVTEVDIDLQVDDEDALAPMLDESWVGAAREWQYSTSGLRYRFISYARV